MYLHGTVEPWLQIQLNERYYQNVSQSSRTGMR